MKVAELDGAQLDAWVARADGRAVEIVDQGENTGPRFYARLTRTGAVWWPSSKWSQGGPLIERERIVTFPDGAGGWAAFVQENRECSYVDTTAYDEMRGPTLLIAAMRAYVAFKFGDEVPDEIPS